MGKMSSVNRRSNFELKGCSEKPFLPLNTLKGTFKFSDFQLSPSWVGGKNN